MLDGLRDGWDVLRAAPEAHRLRLAVFERERVRDVRVGRDDSQLLQVLLDILSVRHVVALYDDGHLAPAPAEIGGGEGNRQLRRRFERVSGGDPDGGVSSPLYFAAALTIQSVASRALRGR